MMIIRRLVLFAASNSNPRRTQSLSASTVRLLSSSSDRYTPSSQRYSGDDKLARLKHKDWLAPNEVLKIFENVKDPSFLMPAYQHYSKRKDYQPTESLYALLINKFGQAKMFDEIEEVMITIKLEKRCRFSEEFFYNLMRIYGNLAGRINRAIEILFGMPDFGCWPSAKSFNFILNLLVSAKLFDEIHKIFVSAPKLGVEIDACCLNILIKGLCESGNLEAALQLLDEFPKQKSRPNVMTFSPLIRGFCNKGKFEEAFKVLERMEKERIEPDTITFNILISGLRKKGRVEEGIDLLERMKLKGCEPNPGTYQEVLYGLLDKKRNLEAKEMMSQMISWGMRPSFLSYKKMVLGLCETKSVVEMDWVLRQMVNHGFVPKTGMWWKAVSCVVSKNNDSQANLDRVTACKETPG
ncbi:Pentatricopeptide repeat [Arabidopsis thaliana x Arabidopsis arenosa]|uniref:Pentatricopeptide repeat n=1 Tax=Arabidopsis thaliana x Arabidopsis arenosa TaxID=1240361 RepID=A0A8T2ATI4_9BRAS|nr:Pentatricopeptide repeat [Arabidopsis thaliana x Arabidopsis arenosa]